MLVKLVLFGFLAISLFPYSVFSQEQEFYETCNNDGSCKRFYKFNGSLYYFETTEKSYTWNEAAEICLNMFLPERSDNLASFQTKQEFDFMVAKMKSLSIKRALIGGTRGSGKSKFNWYWTDKTTMNETLVPFKTRRQTKTKTYDDELWGDNEPNWFEKKELKMEINNDCLNDLPKDMKIASFICKIPCTENTCNIDLPDQCSPAVYKTLNEASRAATTVEQHVQFADNEQCNSTSPSWEGKNWYRFEGAAGTRMQTYNERKVDNRDTHCGTKDPVRAEVYQPIATGQTRDFCVLSSYKNCGRQITRCNGFFVYYLPSTHGCNRRYCGMP